MITYIALFLAIFTTTSALFPAINLSSRMKSGTSINFSASEITLKGAELEAPSVILEGNVTITDETSIKGELSISNNCIIVGTKKQPISLQNVTIGGNTTLLYTTAQGIISHGTIDITHTTIKGTLESSDTIRLTESSVENILVQEEKSNEADTTDETTTKSVDSKTPEIFLTNKSTVTGTITFIGKKGIVHVDKKSKVKGRVINGDVVKGR